MPEIAIIIPSRNEEFLARTIQDLTENLRSDYEIIAILDGAWANPPVPQHERVTIIYHPDSIGQRAACNEGARVATSKWLMKLDAHCAVAEGMDTEMLKAAEGHEDWTLVPLMRNLHIFNWKCPDGHTRYQSPSGACQECGQATVKDVVWIAKNSPKSMSYCFTPEPHFDYFGQYNKRPEGQGDITETMSLQGSCFMLTKEKWLELDVCDESWGIWGSQGIEVACKTWLSGGRVVCVHNTFYAHCFRTQGGDFGFPYHLSGRQVEHAKKTARDLFFTNSWDKQVRPLSWLVERFWPVKGWEEKDLAKIKEYDHVIHPH